MSAREIGLFPLAAVLVPGELMPLHIFEERYRRLIADCEQHGQQFALLYADDDGTREVGCTAALVEVAERFDDGRLNIVVRGEEVVRGRRAHPRPRVHHRPGRAGRGRPGRRRRGGRRGRALPARRDRRRQRARPHDHAGRRSRLLRHRRPGRLPRRREAAHPRAAHGARAADGDRGAARPGAREPRRRRRDPRAAQANGKVSQPARRADRHTTKRGLTPFGA